MPRFDNIVGHKCYVNTLPGPEWEDAELFTFYSSYYFPDTVENVIAQYGALLVENGYSKTIDHSSAGIQYYGYAKADNHDDHVLISLQNVTNNSGTAYTLVAVSVPMYPASSAVDSSSDDDSSDSSTPVTSPEPSSSQDDADDETDHSLCPTCGIEMFLDRRLADGTLVFKCRNPKCTQYGRSVYVKP